jgi:hypothetical protein
MYLAPTNKWYIERITWFLAGIFTLTGSVLAAVHSKYWLILTGFVSVNLLILATTGFCLVAQVLHKFGVRTGIQECK